MSAPGIAPPPPATAAAVANEFLALGQADGVPIDQMKLQKLLFYSQAWHLAMVDSPLFEDEVEAWPWGPVVRRVYSETASYGRQPVETQITILQKTGQSILDFTFLIPPPPSDHAKAFIRSVWDAYKGYTGVQLSNATHAPGEPWTIVKEKYGTLAQKPTIPNDLIKEVFKRKLNVGAGH